MFKKKWVLFLFLPMVFVLSACGQKVGVQNDSLQISSGELAQKVDNWRILTNPAFRYEFRYPRDWSAVMSGEDGVVVNVFSSDQTTEDEDIRIVSYTNWKQNYTMEEFYAKQYQDLPKTVTEKESIKISGYDGVWFKKVKNMVPDNPEAEVDVITIKTSDSFVEIIIKRNFETARTILNSLKFYGNTGIEIK
ncbi:MAG: hypothetical protein WCT18_03910 [Patescibacteria group bacterium]